MRDAESHADEDRRRREEAETRNVAENLQYQTEKFVAENGDKIPDDKKSEINEALTELRGVLGGSDIEAIKSAHEKLSKVSQEAGAAMYAQQPAGDGAPGAEQAGPAGDTGTPNAGADDVVDAEIVDEDGTDRK
jgi:molecular chaperone DnaK